MNQLKHFIDDDENDENNVGELQETDQVEATITLDDVAGKRSHTQVLDTEPNHDSEKSLIHATLQRGFAATRPTPHLTKIVPAEKRL